MAVPHVSENFADLLDPQFREVFDNRIRELPDMVPTIFSTVERGPRGDQFKVSNVGEFDDWQPFAGSVVYDSLYQGYDVTATHLEFVSGMQVERKLFDDDLYNIMNQRPRKLATAAVRTRQKHAARIFNNAFSVDTMFYNNTEGVATCSNAHTTTSGASTATGFDNLGTAAFSHTALVAARIQMRGFRNDRGGRMSVMPNEIWHPPGIYDKVEEVIKSTLRSSDANNAKNVHMGAYTAYDWEYLTDANNWFLCDGEKRKENLEWHDRVSAEFAMAEDLDTLIAKWRGYMRYSYARNLWHFIFGAQVS